MHQLAIALFCFLFNLACVPHPSPPPDPPGPRDVDAGSLTCGDVCQHLSDMGCPSGRPTPAGHTCLDVCRNVQDSGIVAWDLACVFTSATCGQADRCR